jgi:predicted ATP-grasp superfamily ATP-dependent carboligase
MLMRAFDKAATVRLAATCGVEIPRTRFPESDDECIAAAAEVGWPCVVKPRFSHSWDGRTFLPDRGCAYASNADELRKAVTVRRQEMAWPMIQACVPGMGRGVFALCDCGQVVAWFAHERLRDVQPTGSGSSLRRSIALDDRLRTPAARLLAAMQWHGPAMVEFRDAGGDAPVLMEVNGRFWNSLQLAVDAGVDFPRLWIDLVIGHQVESAGSYAEGVTSRWLWGDVKRFLRIAAGPPSGYTGPYPSRWQGLKELFGPQPAGTRLEVWRPSDPWPAMGEWVQGVQEVVSHG